MGKTKGKRCASPKQKQTKEQVPQRGFKEARVLAVVSKGQNERKKTNRGASVAASFQGSTRFGQWRIRRWRIIRTRFWKSRSRSFLLLSSLPLFFFLLTANTSRDEAVAASLSDCWSNHRRALAAFVEILPSIRIKFNDFLIWHCVCFAFYTRSFPRSGAFHDDEVNWFNSKPWPQCR